MSRIAIVDGLKKPNIRAICISAALLIVAGGLAFAAQDKYTLQVPGGLAFSEFRGYESWPVISISENQGVIAVIMGNPATVGAFKAGVPGNGQPFPDGAKMAKIHWIPKKQKAYPGAPTVPGSQHDVDFMVKDSKRFADSDGATARSTMIPHPIRSAPPLRRILRRRHMTRSAGPHATRW